MSALVLSHALLWIAVTALAAAVYALTRLIREFLNTAAVSPRGTPKGLAIDALAPPFAQASIAGELLMLGVERDQPTYLLFTGTGCMVCEYVLGQIAGHLSEWPRLPGDFIVVSDAAPEYFDQWPALTSPSSPVKILAGSDLHRIYRIPTFPHLVLVSAEGRIKAYRGVSSWKEIRTALYTGSQALSSVS